MNVNPLGVVLNVLLIASYSSNPRCINIFVYSTTCAYVRYEPNIILLRVTVAPEPAVLRIDAKISSLLRYATQLVGLYC